MKKVGKFMVSALSVAALAGSAYYLVKNVINKDSSDDFDDFEDEFDDFDFNDEGEADTHASSENREYVTLNITKDTAPEADAEKEPEATEEETEAGVEKEQETAAKPVAEEKTPETTEEPVANETSENPEVKENTPTEE